MVDAHHQGKLWFQLSVSKTLHTFDARINFLLLFRSGIDHGPFLQQIKVLNHFKSSNGEKLLLLSILAHCVVVTMQLPFQLERIPALELCDDDKGFGHSSARELAGANLGRAKGSSNFDQVGKEGIP